jgi:hypothetical protein
MFGSSKNSNGTGPSAPSRTGIERAKAERAPDQPTTTVDDLALEPATEQAALKAAVAKNGFSFAEKLKPKPAPASNESAAHLYVGANIRLKGEIAGCDMMRIEGTFEGTAQAR